MKSINLALLCIGLLFTATQVSSQETAISPTIILTPVAFEITEPLRDNPVISNNEFSESEFYMNAQRDRKINPDIVPPDFNDIPPDPGVQRKSGWIQSSKASLNNFAGQNSGSFPPDANGTVGENYYFQVVNVTYAIYDKTDGSIVAGPSPLNSIFNSSLPGAGCNSGDPIVLWDEHADRWLYAEFSLCSSTDYMLIAVSQTNDPTGSWYSWSYDVDDMPDYMKFGIWQDGYYMATNTGGGNDVYVFDRATMLTGGANPTMIGFDNAWRPTTFDGFHCILPLDNDGPWAPDGSPGQFITIVDDGQGNAADQLWTYELVADWITPLNSTFDRTQTLDVNAFSGNFNNSWNNIPQMGTSQTLDGLSTILMYRAQYRNFSGVERLVCAHAIAESSSEAALRWYELENTGSGWSIRQQSTYNPDNISRWNMSIAMNGDQEIGIGYSVCNATMYPGIRYIGQSSSANILANSTLDIAETVIWEGNNYQTSYNRWGDYSNISVDPSDDYTFWYTNEYVSPSTHGTRIASFNFVPPSLTADFSSNLTTVVAWNSVNFTDLSLASPSSWNWTFEGGTPESFSGQTPPSVTYSTDGFFDVTLTVGNGSETHTTTKTNFIHVSNCSYCASVYTNTSDDWISNVTFNTINNSSSSLGYEDFTSLVTNVEKNSTYNLSVTINVVGPWVQHCFAFIDWNQDCDFADSGESYDLGQVSGTGTSTLSANIIVPEDALQGLTQMRVVEKYNANPGPCENSTYGEVEDYTINVTGGMQEIELSAFLEGSFNGFGMETDLASWIPLDQPYDELPWEYPGTENVVSLPNGNVVDWVLVELREALTPAEANTASLMGRQAAFILVDGQVVGLDGSSNIQFNNATSKNIYALLWHRNHLAVISAKALLPAGGSYIYDFTDRIDKAFGGPDAQKELGAGIWGMIAGDGDRNGMIDSGDKSTLWDIESGSAGYINTDYNLDGQSNNIDKDEYWLPNSGKGTQVPD